MTTSSLDTGAARLFDGNFREWVGEGIGRAAEGF
jgi:hypothetical protein